MRLALREALLAFRRWPALSALSVTTIAFALFVASLYGLVALNLHRTLQSIEERVEVVLYVIRGTPVEVVTLALGDIQAFPEVASATYITADDALQRALDIRFRGSEREPHPACVSKRLPRHQRHGGEKQDQDDAERVGGEERQHAPEGLDHRHVAGQRVDDEDVEADRRGGR